MIRLHSRFAQGAPPPEGRSLKRLEFEMALEIADNGKRSLGEFVQEATEAVGGDLVFVLPATPEGMACAFVRLIDGARSGFVQVCEAHSGFAIVEDEAIDAAILALVRSSVTVLERIRADRSLVAALATNA